MSRLERGLDRAKQTSEAIAAYGLLAAIVPLFALNKVIVRAPNGVKILGRIIDDYGEFSSGTVIGVDRNANSITIPDGATASILVIKKGKTTVENIILDYTNKYKNGKRAKVKTGGKIRSNGFGKVPLMKGGETIELNPVKSTHTLEDGTVITWSPS